VNRGTTGISAGTLRLEIEYGLTLPFTVAVTLSVGWLVRRRHRWQADDSMYNQLSAIFPHTVSRRRCFIALVLLIFLPIIPLVGRPRLLRPADVTVPPVTSLPLMRDCVVTATDSAHQVGPAYARLTDEAIDYK